MNSEDTEDKPTNPSGKKITGPIRNLIRSMRVIHNFNRRYLISEFLLRLIINTMPFAIAWFSAVFINRVTSGNFESILDPALLAIFVIYVTLPFFSEAASVIQGTVRQKFYMFFGQWLDIRFMDKKASVDIQTYEDPVFSDQMTKVKENSYKLANTIDWFFDIWGAGIQVVIAISIVASYKWWIAIVLFLALLPDMYAESKYGKRVWGIWDAKTSIKRRYYEIGSHFDAVPALIEMKVSGTKKYLRTLLDMLSGQFNLERGKSETGRMKLKLATTLIISVVSGGLILFLMRDVVAGLVEIGTFVFILASISGLRFQMGEALRGISVLNSDNRYVNDIHEFLDTSKVLKNGSISLEDSTPGIEFQDVDFAYPNSAGESNVFNKLNFAIKPGEKIAIVGVNGAGKTTLTKLFMRFYDPTSGTVRIGGHDARHIDIFTYYKKIGYLSQEYDKFKMKTREAIAIGDTDAPHDLDKVIEAAKKAGAHEFISAWPHGYDTQLGKEFEGGVEPSIGQWQKLALARLFYRNPQIWILDEPTASIDSVAEMEVFQELEKLPDDKTVILISHRFNTVKNADKIMVLEHGQIKEFGSHHKLMAIHDGIYKKLFTLQKDSFGS